MADQFAQDFRGSQIRAGDGGSGGRGGDVGSHNTINSHNVISTTTVYGQQIIVNSLAGMNLSTTPQHIPGPNNMLISASLPPQPAIFVGRDNLVIQGIGHITSTMPARVAILGQGGIGKTSLALAVLHHEVVKEHFAEQRFFVPCETLKSGFDLALAVLQTLGGSLGERKDLLASLEAKLLHSGSLLLVLDNFETPWFENSSPEEVERVIGLISGVDTVSLVITMRGDAPPMSVSWSLILPENGLQPLAQDAAESMYLKMQLRPMKLDTQSAKDLAELMREVDHIPLAVALLAAQGRNSPPTILLKRWTKMRTKLLKSISAQSTRLTNIAVSISLSIDSNVIKQNPECLQLLGLIAFLPSGIPYWIDLIEKMAPQLEDAYLAVDILCQSSLVFKTEHDALTMLSPTRHYINEELKEKLSFNIMEDVGPILQFINEGTSQKSEDLLLLGLPNITHIVVEFLKINVSEEALSDALNCSKYLQEKNIFALSMMEKIHTVIQGKCSQATLAAIQLHYGTLLNQTNSWVKAKEMFSSGYKIYSQLDDQLGIANALQNLGVVSKMLDNNEEASKLHIEALDIYKQLGDQHGIAQASDALGLALSTLGQYDKAIEQHEAAYKTYSQLQGKLGMVNSLNNLGDTLRLLGRCKEAAEHHQMAYRIAKEMQSQYGMANSLHSLGEALKMLGDYAEAVEQYRAAYDISQKIRYQLGMSNILDSLGTALRMLGKIGEAAEQFKKAYGLHSQIGDELGMANSMNGLGLTSQMLGNYPEAVLQHKAAFRIYYQFKYQLGMATSVENLGDALQGLGKYPEATEHLRAAYQLYSQLRNRGGMANCLQSMGNALQLLEDYAEAIKQHKAAYQIYDEAGNQLGMANALKSLARACEKIGKHEEAKEYFTSAEQIWVALQGRNKLS